MSITARQEDKRTEEIHNIAYTIVLDELWYFTCPSCPESDEAVVAALKTRPPSILTIHTICDYLYVQYYHFTPLYTIIV